MVYRLQELLTRLGAPDTLEKDHVEWHYFDAQGFDLAGCAEVRMEASGGRLVAEIRHSHQEREDDQGLFDAQFTQAFYMSAVLIGRDMYTITKIRLNGREYLHPSRAVVDKGFDIFHARASTFNATQVDQSSKTDDKSVPSSAFDPLCRRAMFSRMMPAAPLCHETFGVVIPFRPRQPARIARAG